MVVYLYSTLTLRPTLCGLHFQEKQGGSDQRRYPERWCAESHGASEYHHKQPVDEVQSGEPNSGVRIKFILLLTVTSINQLHVSF